MYMYSDVQAMIFTCPHIDDIIALFPLELCDGSGSPQWSGEADQRGGRQDGERRACRGKEDQGQAVPAE